MREDLDIETAHWEHVDQVWKSMDPVRVGFIGDSYEGSIGLALSTLTDNRFFKSSDHRLVLEVENQQTICVRCADLELRPSWANLVDAWSTKPLVTSIMKAAQQLNIDRRTLSLGSRDPFKECHELLCGLQWLFTLCPYARYFSFTVKSGGRLIRDEFREGRLLLQERLGIDKATDIGFEWKIEMEPSFFPDHEFSVKKLKARFENFHWGEMEPLGDLDLVKVEDAT